MVKVTLPCGYYNPIDIKTPDLITEIELREMTGFEEDILGDKKKRDTVIDEVLSRCIQSFGPVTRPKPELRDKFFMEPYLEKMLINDRTFLMIKLRELSLGSAFAFEATCPVATCKHRHPRMEVDLSELSITQMEDPTKRTYNTVTPSGKTISFRLLTGKDERVLNQLQKKQGENFFSQMLMLRIIEMDGESVKNVRDLKALTVKDRDHLRESFDKVEGGVDTQIELTCDDCGTEWKMALPMGQPSFFFPSGINP